KPLTFPPEPMCAGGPFCDWVERAPAGADACFVANDTIHRAETALRAVANVAPTVAPASSPPAAPLYLDRVAAHLDLTADERGALERRGMVVLDRLPYVDYARAYHDIFQEQLPVFVTFDSILHAVFRATEGALEAAERKTLEPALARVLTGLQAALRAASRGLDRQVVNDLDIYLGVAIELADLKLPAARASRGSSMPPPEPRPVPRSLFGNDAEIARVTSALAARELAPVELFGRRRMIDASRYEPRGHYVAPWNGSRGLDHYFQAITWLMQLELNLVTRGCASSAEGHDSSDTPREIALAGALAGLLGGVAQDLAAFERVYGAYLGTREDVPLADLARLLREAGARPGDADAPAKLRAAMGKRYARATRTHFQAEGCGPLSAVTTLLGLRVSPDTGGLTGLVHDAVPERKSGLSLADVGYVLGHDRAKAHLRAQLAMHPSLGAALDAGRARTAASTARPTDVYTSWLSVLTALGEEPPGVVPRFAKTPEYADARLNSALVGFGQLRHAYILLAGQGYDAYGCEIPDGYVEPHVPAWDALAAHVDVLARRGLPVKRLAEVVGILARLARRETQGLALTEPERRWLGMVAENVPSGGYGGDSGEPPKWTGWYFDLFADREKGAERPSLFVADYFTLTNAEQVLYAGADGPRLGLFLVDVGGAPRVMVGPVAKGYETAQPLRDPRLTDRAALAVPEAEKRAPWRASYAAPERPLADEPATWVASCQPPPPRSGAPVPMGLSPMGLAPMVAAPRAVESLRIAASLATSGEVEIGLLDHHGDPLGATARLPAGPEPVIALFEGPGVAQAKAYRVRVHTQGRVSAWSTSPSVNAGFTNEGGELDAALVRTRPAGLSPLHAPPPPPPRGAAKGRR
ncbi:MAG TPA: DUF3160 domain-containing protein, partial [Polyangiaceae bacterium]|nr:DUF3160 domain-containing protein [Polyangiaceae bacterium]